MRFALILSLLGFSLALPSAAQQVPQMNTVQPDSGKAGSVLVIHGLYLGKAKVDSVYLTDHTFDMMVKVLAQTEDSIQFRIPPEVKPGKLQLLVKTTGKEPLLLEQPVYVTIEDKPRIEVAATQNASH
jgi:hypothetical protein